jgi:elongation factor G
LADIRETLARGLAGLRPHATFASYRAMPDFGTADIHNVLLAGSRSSGKTTLADALLFHAGEVSRQGTVDAGTSVSDFEKEEQAHHYSVYSTLLHATHQGKRINILDLPGAPDFIGQAIACLPAAETMVLVMDPDAGIDSMSRRLVKLAHNLDLPVAIVVSHIGEAGARLGPFMRDLKEAFGRGCLPINLPADSGAAVIDCLLNGEGDSDLGPVAGFHTELLDQIVEIDDALMERYLEGEEPNYEALHEPFERAMDQAHVIPVCFTDALSGAGVGALLDIIVRHFPSPPEGNARPFFIGEGEDETPFVYSDDASKTLLARVFHVTADPYLGKLCFFRVYQGRMRTGDQLFVGDGKRPIRLSHLFQLQGKERTGVKEIFAGDMGAIAKVEDLHLSDVLHDDHALDHVHHKALPYPTPLHALAVVPKTRGDEDKIAEVLARIREEDPTFQAHFDSETHELVVYGLGEMHLSLVIERIKNQGVDVETKPPKIAYHETIMGRAEGHYRHKKQSGGAGQFGEVKLRVEPLERGGGFEFVDKIVGGVIPKGFMPAIEKGIRTIMRQGIVAGYPIEDVRVTVFDGKTHSVDSKEIAFKAAGKFAFKDAFLKAMPQILEPIVNVEVTTPDGAVGSITGDLSSRRGRVFATDVMSSGKAVVKASVPLADMMDYEPALKSMTKGRGSYSMELSHYDAVPARIAQDLVAKFDARRGHAPA